MRTLQFNFNNEVDVFDILQEDDGRIIIPGENGPMAEYANIQQFAEIYAQARDVKTEHLKNWTLVEQGDVVSFVLRAGTAGVSVESVLEQLDGVVVEIRAEGMFHPLSVERLCQEVMKNTDADVMTALATSTVPDVAREVYDRLDRRGVFAQTALKPVEAEEVDDRSEIEKYLDAVQECDESLAFFATLLNMNTRADKTAILESLAASSIPYTAKTLRELYENALMDAMDNGMNVNGRFDALIVMTQAVPGNASEEEKRKIIAAASLAKRERINVKLYVAGRRHIRKTFSLLTADELNARDVYMVDNAPLIVTFDANVDAEMEEERRQAKEAEESVMEEDYMDDEDDYVEDDEDDWDE